MVEVAGGRRAYFVSVLGFVGRIWIDGNRIVFTRRRSSVSTLVILDESDLDGSRRRGLASRTHDDQCPFIFLMGIKLPDQTGIRTAGTRFLDDLLDRPSALGQRDRDFTDGSRCQGINTDFLNGGGG